MADTPLIANIDVDMLPSASLSASLQAAVADGGGAGGRTLLGQGGGEAYVQGCTEEGRVYVIPAFETSCGGPSYADKAAVMDKIALQGLIKEDCIAQFRCDHLRLPVTPEVTCNIYTGT